MKHFGANVFIKRSLSSLTYDEYAVISSFKSVSSKNVILKSFSNFFYRMSYWSTLYDSFQNLQKMTFHWENRNRYSLCADRKNQFLKIFNGLFFKVDGITDLAFTQYAFPKKAVMSLPNKIQYLIFNLLNPPIMVILF